MDLTEIFQRLAVAVGLGLLVGLQRERVDSQLAGIRTFALITALGALAALLAGNSTGWVIGLGAIALAAIVVSGNIVATQTSTPDPGLTTEIAVLVMYVVGAYAMVGHTSVALAVGGTVALLLHYREPMHEFVRRIGVRDLSAIMQFVLIALVILPVLPNRAYGPFSVINPHRIWLMVVLIVAISLGGYVAYKLFGGRAGALLGGVLGGLISSTATTVSYARRSVAAPAAVPLATVVILIASAISFVRVIVEIGVVAPGSLAEMVAPLLVMLGLTLLLSGLAYLFARKESANLPEEENPAELKSALMFGFLYAMVIFAVAATKQYFGNRGLYVVALASGLTDMDAITLSISQLVKDGRVAASLGWKLILVASLANLAFKGGAVAVLASGKLTLRVALAFGLIMAAGLAMLWFWPESWTLRALPLPSVQPTTAPAL